MLAPVKFPLTVFYDASCPMCANEMHALKARDATQSLALVDCSAPEYRNEIAEGEGITREGMLGLLHTRDANGRWLVGVESFAAVYRAAGLEFVARLLEAPVLRRVLDAMYPWIARHRQQLSRWGVNTAVCLVLRKGA